MRKLVTAGILVTVMAGVFALGAPARQQKRPDFVYSPELGWWVHEGLEWASEYTGSQKKRIPLATYIRCFASDTPFEAGLRRGGDSGEDAHLTIAYYVTGTSYVNVRATTCRNAWLFTGKDRTTKPVITETTAGAMATLLHEALHRQGLDGERLTECYGNSSTKYAGWNTWWQYAPGDSDASWAASEQWGNWAMKLAFQYSRHTVDVSYSMSKPACLRRVSQESWADLVR
jgi:hypothetical protein